MKSVVALMLFAMFLGACASQPTVPESSDEAGETTFDMAPAGGDLIIRPETTAKEHHTRIEGRLMVGNQIAIPLKFAKVQIFNSDGKMIDEANSDMDGNFVFAGTYPAGAYTFKVDSERYQGKITVNISPADITAVVIPVESKYPSTSNQ
ncbi:MAG TPA: hypothetical protein VF412_13785 [Bdellovibrio sp.]|uniref:hypothetical protein n=1 Tax=Bdellovibrio sp. TaxID=28201 RepID=UPI002EF849B4